MMHDRGFAGASAHRESLAQGSARDASNWRRGAEGERSVGSVLEDLVVAGVRVAHDRRIPASLANIDHIAVCSTGVYVIDTKNYGGHPRVETIGGGSATAQRLYVGRDDRSELAYGVRRQVGVVRVTLAGDDIPVRGVLCFVGASWEVLNGYVVAGVAVTSPERLADLLTIAGPYEQTRVDAIHRRLLDALDPA